MNTESARLRLKTRVFTALIVASNVLGNFSLSWGMRRVGRLVSFSPWAYIQALLDPWVALGVALLIIWLLSHMTLLSWADLSYVLPVTSVGYVLAVVMGHVFLKEDITVARWMGVGLIMAGVALVSRTSIRTRDRSAEAGR